MGLGKTIYFCFSYCCDSSAVPLVPPNPPILAHHDSDLTAEHFVGRVWGMPSPSTSSSSSATKAKAKETKAQDLAEEQYARLVVPSERVVLP